MNQFPLYTKFKHNWRTYQCRVLAELDRHIRDNHLHIIAPSGSGKTILGIEVCVRLNQATLIIVPSISLKNQWIRAFVNNFLPYKTLPNWISDDIKNVQFFNVVTYQAIHSIFRSGKSDDWNAILESLKVRKIQTLVLDESHHLQNAWCNALDELKKVLKPQVIGLSATPPYDTTHSKWKRYIGVNGEIDTEITIPELIQNNNLCAHQDFVYFSQPTKCESDVLEECNIQREHIFEMLLRDEALKSELENHPYLLNPSENLEWIYTHFRTYLALLAYLFDASSAIGKEHWDLLKIDSYSLPPLDYVSIEFVLDFYLFEQANIFKNKEHQKNLISHLKSSKLYDVGRFHFSNNEQMVKLVSSSISKLGSIQKIVDYEYGQLGESLRLVILTDYIRKEYISDDLVNDKELDRIGAIPIFEELRRGNLKDIKLCVLTGSIVIIPVEALSIFNQLLAKTRNKEIIAKPLTYDNQYVQIPISNALNQKIVTLVTDLFEFGNIEVIIGTKALLGEGWNAPSINSLILASFVGSFVNSNQMRGRAIRKDSQNEHKTANIWHLACLDASQKDGGRDISLLERRFQWFLGVSRNGYEYIESGIERLQLNLKDIDENSLQLLNNSMLESASKRSELGSRWLDALNRGTTIQRKVSIPFYSERAYRQLNKVSFQKSFWDVLGVAFFGSVSFLTLYHLSLFPLSHVVLVLSLIGSFGFVYKAVKSIKQLFSARNIDRTYREIGRVLLNSLVHESWVSSDVLNLSVQSKSDYKGNVECSLVGATTYEKSIFIHALMEILREVDNPRYLLKLKHENELINRKYFNIPTILAKKKSSAQYFCDEWNRLLQDCTLIYTRSKEGRKSLLKARVHNLGIHSNPKIIQKKVWV